MFNKDLSQLALDMIDANPNLWYQKVYHYYSPCGLAHCWIGWCDVLSGNWKGDMGSVSQKTMDLMGLSSYRYFEFINPYNSLARLKALHTFNITGVYGINGYDADGYDRYKLDRNGYSRDEMAMTKELLMYGS